MIKFLLIILFKYTHSNEIDEMNLRLKELRNSFYQETVWHLKLISVQEYQNNEKRKIKNEHELIAAWLKIEEMYERVVLYRSL